MDQTRLHQLEEQCIQNCDPPCSAHCPVHVNIRLMLSQAAKGDFTDSYQTLRKAVIFPEIIARTCEQPCQTACYRGELGGAIRVADIELAACSFIHEPAKKTSVLPRKVGKIAVIGAGLCGMTASLELDRKGYQVELFDNGKRPGGSLWKIQEDRLPGSVIERETTILGKTGINYHPQFQIDPKTFTYEDYDAVMIATGTGSWDDPDLERDNDTFIVVDAVTFHTSRPGLFAGGGVIHPPSTILSLSDGRRAAISIDRYLQKVSLTASRINEGAYDTRLITKTSGVLPKEVILPANPAAGFSVEEAQEEARRCLQCECMECVKVCEYLSMYGSYPGKYVRDVYNNMSIIMRQRTANKFINSCTICGLCKEVCPTDLDMGEVILGTRRTMVATKKMPVSAHDFALRDMEFSNGERFAATLPPPDGKTCQYAFFPGCQLAASSPEYIPQIYTDLSLILPGLGVMLRCCGAPADWSGEVSIFNETANAFRSEWNSLGKPKLILACTSCNQMIRKILPGVVTIPLWKMFKSSASTEKEMNYGGKRYAIHDPCTSRHEDAWQDSVRELLTDIGVQPVELEMSRKKTECCGYGGVAWLANPELVHKIIQRRVSENDADYLTYCVMCRDLFAAEGKPSLHLLDLLYGKEIDKLAVRNSPDYSQRHENRARVKQKMVRLLQGKDSVFMDDYEKIKLEISEAVRLVMENRLILTEDVQKVIEYAEKSGETFLNQKTGHFLAFFKPNLITYWVEYTKNGDVYTVHDAYSHRMQVGGDTSL